MRQGFLSRQKMLTPGSDQKDRVTKVGVKNANLD